MAAYLTTPEDGGVVNLMDYGLSLGRRFRALKLWMVIRAYGAEGLASLISGHIELARRLAAEIDAEPGWELLAPVPFSTVCFRRHPAGVDDEGELRRLNSAIIDHVNADGRAFVSHTDLGGRYAIRVAIGNMATTAEHVDMVWELDARGRRRLTPCGRAAVAQPGSGSGSVAAGAIPEPFRSSRTTSWIEPAIGIATSAPRTPISSPPIRTATSTRNAESWTVFR